MEKLVAERRPLSLQIHNSRTGKMITPHEMYIDGKKFTGNVEFKPGVEHQVKAYFQKFHTYVNFLCLEPGEGGIYV